MTSRAIETTSDRHGVVSMLALNTAFKLVTRHQVARMDRTDRFHVLLFAYDEKQIVSLEDTDSTISRL
jgi:predicted membrane chloride channel (bestrophin family)